REQRDGNHSLVNQYAPVLVIEPQSVAHLLGEILLHLLGCVQSGAPHLLRDLDAPLVNPVELRPLCAFILSCVLLSLLPRTLGLVAHESSWLCRDASTRLSACGLGRDRAAP